MPIFRKEQAQSLARRKRLNYASGFGIREKGKKVLRVSRTEWAVVHTMFSAVDSYAFGKISESINDFAKKYPKRKINVLDWGCGWGNSVRQLAEENSHVKSFGFTKDAYAENLNPGKGVIFNTSKTAFLRFLKKSGLKFDVIYSNLGLEHLIDPVAHIIDISKYVNVGGKIFPGFSFGTRRHTYENMLGEFTKANLKPEFVNNRFVYLTRVK